MTDRPPTPLRRRPGRRPPARAGFSFAEVLFAVIILGIGFILVAAIFPVAIQQTQSTAEDAAAAAAAREAVGVIGTVPTLAANPQYLPSATVPQLTANPAVGVSQLTLFPPTVKSYLAPTNAVAPAGSVPPPAIVLPFGGRQADLIRGNLISPTDPRFAYVPFYRREENSPVAQIIVIAMTARNQPVFDPVLDTTPPTPPANYTVTPVARSGAADPNQYVINADSVSLSATGSWVGEGCAVPTYASTGRSYRLGRSLSTSLTVPSLKYELEAGAGLVAGPAPTGLWGPSTVLDTTVDTNSIVPTATVQPVGAYARLSSAPGSLAGRITLSATLAQAVASEAHVVAATADTDNGLPAMAVPGTFVVVADDFPYLPGSETSTSFKLPLNKSAAYPNLVVGAYNGMIYRLGQPVPPDASATPKIAPGTFELDPQYATVPAGSSPLIPVTGNGGPRARVYLVGSGRAASPLPPGTVTPASTLTTYTGAAQDVGVFTTFVPVQ